MCTRYRQKSDLIYLKNPSYLKKKVRDKCLLSRCSKHMLQYTYLVVGLKHVFALLNMNAFSELHLYRRLEKL